MTFWRDREPFWDEPPSDPRGECVQSFLDGMTEDEQREYLQDCYGVDITSLDGEEVWEHLYDLLYDDDDFSRPPEPDLWD